MVALRSFGKAAFIKLRDRSGELQVHVKKDALGDQFERFKLTDLGDFVGVKGTLFRSKTGELTLAATELPAAHQGAPGACRRSGTAWPTWRPATASATWTWSRTPR